MDEYTCDLLVVGAGMAGLTAAGRAASMGKTVVVVEKAKEAGGSAALSGGVVWTAASKDAFSLVDPHGRADLEDVILSRYDDLIDWIGSVGVEVGDPIEGVLGYGRGRVVDILGYLEACRGQVRQAGGIFSGEVTVKSLLVEDGRVAGALVADRDGETRLLAQNTLLATGGFQADPALRKEHIGDGAGSMLLRSNPVSRGDGLRLGRSVGAALSVRMDGFYGHLVPTGLASFEFGDFVRLSQLYANQAVVVNVHGQRFTDESLGYARIAQGVVAQPDQRAVVLFDQSVQDEIVGQPAAGVPELEILDRFQEALDAGGRGVVADSWEDIARAVGEWDFDGEAIAGTIHAYNRTEATELEPGRKLNYRPLTKGPFYALEVQPAITFTMGGLQIDEHSRVLDGEGTPIPGLLAAGADTGVFAQGYGGGLALGGVFGLIAAETVQDAA